jgi:L-lactate dehydrogenase complex protein LldG
MANRERFLRKVGTALSTPTTHGRGELDYTDLSASPPRERPRDLLGLLAENAAALNIQLHLVADTAAAGEALGIIAGATEAEWDHQRAVMAWDTPLLNQLGAEAVLQESGMVLYRSPSAEAQIDTARRATFRQQLGETRIGITTADWCVADTATLVLRNHPGQPVAVSLVPSVHVAVVREEQLLFDFIDLYARLEAGRQEDPEALTGRMTFISGPSKTGDIELVMVHGAHGPRALHLIVIREI